MAELEALRAALEPPQHYDRMIASRENWYRLWSAIDTIEDTQLAVSSAVAEFDWANSTLGVRYLIIYGTLQALVVQQNAVQSAAKMLDIPCKFSDRLLSVRNNRDSIVGHPVTNAGKSRAIFRHSMSLRAMELLTFDAHEGLSRDTVDVLADVEAQSVEVAEKLRGFAQALDSEERARAAHRIFVVEILAGLSESGLSAWLASGPVAGECAVSASEVHLYLEGILRSIESQLNAVGRWNFHRHILQHDFDIIRAAIVDELVTPTAHVVGVPELARRLSHRISRPLDQVRSLLTAVEGETG